MSNPYKEKSSENSKVKGLRITCAVIFFIQIIMTTFPFIWGQLEDGTYEELTAFQLMIQIGGYQSSNAIMLAILSGIFVIFPLIAFFFCILDKKTNWKYLISASCCIICIALITFGIGQYIAIGSLISVFIYLFIFFLNACGFIINYRNNVSE